MVRIPSLLFCAGALLAGCATESTGIERSANSHNPNPDLDLSGCVKIEGSDIGRLITLEVPDADGEGTVSITFTGWITKDGEDNEYIGFTLDGNASFVVKAGLEIFEGSGDSFENPYGTGGSEVKGISYVAICDGEGDDEEPPPPPPDCDLNDDGDTTDEGECDYVPPPPPPDCDHNDDGDTTDEGECHYHPPCDEGGLAVES